MTVTHHKPVDVAPSFHPGVPVEQQSVTALAAALNSLVSGLKQVDPLKDPAPTPPLKSPPLPTPPQTPASPWSPPKPPIPWDQMTTSQQIAYLEQCISSAKKNLKTLEGYIDFHDKNDPISIQELEREKNLVAAYIGQCEFLVTFLEQPPPPDSGDVNPFAGFNFHLPHVTMPNLNHLTAADMQSIELALAQVLSELEEIIGLATSGKNKIQTEAANSNVAITQASLEESKATLKNVEAALYAQKHEALIQKIVNGILGAIFTLIAAVTGNFALAAIMGVMTILNATGAMDKITHAISTTLQDFGVSKKVADIVSAAIVIVAVIVICAATGGEAAEDAMEDVEAEAEKSTSILSKSARFGIIGGVQAFQMTDFTAKLTPFLSHLSNKDQEIVEAIIQTVSALLSLILAGGAMAGLGTQTILSAVRNTLQSSLSFLAKAFTAAAASLQIATAQTTLKQADAEQDLNTQQAFQTFYEKLLKTLTDTINTDNAMATATLESSAKDVLAVIQANTQVGATLANAL